MSVKSQKRRLEVPVFNWAFDIVVAEDVVAYAKSIGWEGGEREKTAAALTLYFNDDLLTTVIVEPDSSAGVVAHEAWHGIRQMLLYVGASLDNEVVAYHLAYLVDEITDFMTASRKKPGAKRA